MANDSTSAGYLIPDDAVVTDDALEDVFSGYVVGVTGIAGSLVRPRWQTNPPSVPGISVNWCAIGITTTNQDDHASIQHSPSGDGLDVLVRHEQLEVLASFYGPASEKYAKRFRESLEIAQNREMLRTNGIAFVSSGPIRNVPELVNNQWQRRYDIQATFNRAIQRAYNIRNIESAEGTISDGIASTDFAVVDGNP